MPSLERVYELGSAEGVFAYSRISPDGRFLAYASEPRDAVSGTGRSQLINVVDLGNRRVVFSEPGIDAYWSTDGRRMMYLSYSDVRNRVSIRDQLTGHITRDVAPDSLGDYYSWGNTGSHDVILTIRGRYCHLNGDRGIMPAATVPSCDRIGVGQRPLLSRDGRRITTFVRGTIVVRNLTDCRDILDTGLPGAKADFSWDGRYIAFHAPKPDGVGYEIQIVDCVQRTVRRITNLAGSSFFPSWTQDGRLLFRYDGDDFRGFIMASNVLSAPERPLPAAAQSVRAEPGWNDVFADTNRPVEELVLVLVWGPWSAHAPQALAELQRARMRFLAEAARVHVVMATDPASREEDIAHLLTRHRIELPRIGLGPEQLLIAEAHNQNPTTLMFRHGSLIDRRLGAQSLEQLREWIAAAHIAN